MRTGVYIWILANIAAVCFAVIDGRSRFHRDHCFWKSQSGDASGLATSAGELLVFSNRLEKTSASPAGSLAPSDTAFPVGYTHFVSLPLPFANFPMPTHFQVAVSSRHFLPPPPLTTRWVGIFAVQSGTIADVRVSQVRCPIMIIWLPLAVMVYSPLVYRYLNRKRSNHSTERHPGFPCMVQEDGAKRTDE